MPTDEANKIRDRIGKRVTFTYPEGTRHGILRDRFVFPSHCHPTCIPYWDVVDLIEFEGDGEHEPRCIRIGYYRNAGQKLVFGGQTTITEPVSVWKKMLVGAAREKPWFRELLEDVMRELENN
jgi:hypothetical protein